MRRRLPPLAALRAFEATARHLKMSEAALELGVSHSAVSQHVKTLEKWFRKDLFDRSGSRLSLTGPGEVLARASTAALDRLAEASRVLEEGNVTERLSIRVEPAFAAKWMRRRLNPLKAHLGRFEIDMWTNHTLPRKFPEQTDLLIHYGRPPKWPGVETVTLAELYGFPACAPALRARLGPIETAKDIGRYHLLHGEDRETWHNWLSDNAVGSVSHMSGTLYDDFGLTVEAALDGEGALIADPVLCGKELESGALVRLSEREVYCTTYFLSCREEALQRAVIRKMRDWITAELSAGLSRGGSVLGSRVRHN